MSAGRSLRESLKWAFVMTWGQRGIATGFTFVLAAILGPHDFGLVALGLAFVALIQVVLEQGISTAIIQREKLDREHLHTAFWLNLAWCLALAGLSIALSGWWAGVTDAPELQDVIVALSGLLVIWGVMIVPLSILQRETRFRELAVCWNVGALTGGVCGLVLALTGAGVWAFVAQQLVMDGVALVGMLVATRWAPHLSFSRRHARELLGFSAGVFVANLGGFVNRRSDTLLMGIFFSPAAVGLYHAADRIVDLVLEFTMRPVGVVSLPHFSRLQNDPAGLRAMVEKCVRFTLVITVPVLLLVAATGELGLAVLGEEWVPAADALALLCVVGMVKGLVFFTGPLLFAVAKPVLRAVMLWALGALSAATVVAVGLALQDSGDEAQIFGMAASRAALFLVAILPINLLILARYGGLRLRELVPALPGPLASGLAAFAVVAGLEATGVFDELRPIVALLLGVTLAGVAALGVLLALDADARAEARALRRGSGKQPVPQQSLRG